MKLLFDTDVLLDVLAERHPHYRASAASLAWVERGSGTGLVAAHAVTTIHYLLSRHLTRRKATEAVSTLLDLLAVATVDEQTLKHALSLNWRDYEDAVTAAAAVAAGATHLITRNVKDFRTLPLDVVSPESLLASLQE